MKQHLYADIVAAMESHPTWVRGLKHEISNQGWEKGKSHPTWVRGLKHCCAIQWERTRWSHPTWVRGLKRNSASTYPCIFVAPYVGAWIETSVQSSECVHEVSHPTWVRGLKRIPCVVCSKSLVSHPTWVRGLKLRLADYLAPDVKSHPTWVRGLKHIKEFTTE